MTQDNHLLDVSSHFSFGENWQSFSQGVGEDEIVKASESLSRLIPENEMKARSFLDIGCGSGLSMVAALRLGASSVKGFDIDPNSCKAAETTLARHMPESDWQVENKSVFDQPAQGEDQFDIIHSWGVLHHTGDMWLAIDRALDRLSPTGRLVIALYRKTPVCGFWKIEKKIYSRSPKILQGLFALIFKFLYLLGIMITGRNPLRYIRDYSKERGMDWHHDIHDWLGGYPYESVTPAELAEYLERSGHRIVREISKPPIAKGIFGTHCDEFVIQKAAEE